MKVVVAQIPEEGMDLDFYKDKKWLVEGLASDDELKEFIDSGLECKCNLRMLKDQIMITGQISTRLKAECSRCGRAFENTVRTNMNMTCIPDNRSKAQRGQDYMDGDVGMNYYHGPTLDVATIAREQFFLTIPMRFLCSEDCKGVCTSCGGNLNDQECTCSTN